MKVLSTDEMKRADQYTCQVEGITSEELMEVAGTKLFECLLKEKNLDPKVEKVVVVSGVGNNGGDGLVIARHLIKKGYRVTTVVVGKQVSMTEETKRNLEKVNDCTDRVLHYEDETFHEEFERILFDATLIIEGIFGIGLNKDVRGLFGKAIEAINESKAYVVSIDIPSGLRGDNGQVAGTCVEADMTLVVNHYKLGNLLNDAKDKQGKTILVPVGIVEGEKKSSKYYLQSYSLPSLPKRKNNSHKYDYGSVLVVGGSEGMTGAPLMSAYAALRTGSGLVTIGIFHKYIQRVNNPYPEIMLRSYDGEEAFIELLNKKDVIAFGPGLGRRESYSKLLEIVLQHKIPIVIDADGLYHLKPLLKAGEAYENIIITPHVGEFANLLNVSSQQILEDPVGAVKSVTRQYGFTVVLKGTCTIIARGEEMYFSNGGNPGMATAGMGDVLTGIISSLVGQGMSPLDAAKLGVYLHAACGDLCAEELGEHAMIATDLLKVLPRVMKGLNDK